MLHWRLYFVCVCVRAPELVWSDPIVFFSEIPLLQRVASFKWQLNIRRISSLWNKLQWTPDGTINRVINREVSENCVVRRMKFSWVCMYRDSFSNAIPRFIWNGSQMYGMDNLSVLKQHIATSCELILFCMGDYRYDDTLNICKRYLVEMLIVQVAIKTVPFQLNNCNFMTWLCSSEVEFVTWKATKVSNQYSFDINSR
jgi:hypothetical protein